MNWKTTISGAVPAVAALVLALHSANVAMPQWIVVCAGFVVAGGFASLGIMSKDSDK